MNSGFKDHTQSTYVFFDIRSIHRIPKVKIVQKFITCSALLNIHNAQTKCTQNKSLKGEDCTSWSIHSILSFSFSHTIFEM